MRKLVALSDLLRFLHRLLSISEIVCPPSSRKNKLLRKDLEKKYKSIAGNQSTSWNNEHILNLNRVYENQQRLSLRFNGLDLTFVVLSGEAKVFQELGVDSLHGQEDVLLWLLDAITVSLFV